MSNQILKLFSALKLNPLCIAGVTISNFATTFYSRMIFHYFILALKIKIPYLIREARIYSKERSLNGRALYSSPPR